VVARMSASPIPNRRVLLGVALVCFANLLLEVVLTRIFSATMFYHFTFLAIALALFGLGASGVYVYVNAERFTIESMPEDMARYARRFAATTLLALVYILANPLQIQTASGGAPAFSNKVVMQMLLLNGVTALPFFYAGLVVAVAVTHYRRHIDRVYFYDLCGAAIAALLAGLLLGWFGAPSLVIAIALSASGAAILFAPPRLRSGPALVGAIALLLVLNFLLGLVSVPSAKGVESGRLVFERWNSFSRVTVEKYAPGQFDVKIDSSASTRVTNTAEGEDWRGDISSLAYALFSPAVDQSLIIGPGGGRDVSHALAAGTRSVTGVEVNPLIADAIMRQAFVSESRDLYGDPRVNVVVDEGRSFVRRSRASYDVIQASLVDTWAATSAGAFALTENTLYTLEAFEDYYDHLTDRGVITMTRWFTAAHGETARLVLLAAGALERRGVAASDVRQHLYLASDGSHATLIAKKRALTVDELARLDAACAASKFVLVLGPRVDASVVGIDKQLGEMVDAGAWSARVEAAPENLEPPTDDRPFFFYFTKPRDLWNVDRLFGGQETVMNPSLWILLALGLAVVGLAVAFIVVPLVVHGRRSLNATGRRLAAPRAVALVYFGVVGLAFITVEIALLQKFTFFLGHPSYALLVILFSLLIGTAIGARISGQFSDRRRALAIASAGAGLLVVCSLYAAVLSPALRQWVAWPLVARVLLSGALVAATGLLMGFMVPTGIRLVSDCDAEIVPWGWGINGATSVIGTVAATVVAIHAGFTTTLLSGACLYGLAAACGLVLAKLAERRKDRDEPATLEATAVPVLEGP
jgi:spermidine synthase